jgi:hypothetical protein
MHPEAELNFRFSLASFGMYGLWIPNVVKYLLHVPTSMIYAT